MNLTAGTLRLTRLALRRDRLRLPLWVAGLTALLAAQAIANADTYPTQTERVGAATVLAANPALRMLRGAAADTSAGALLVSDAFWIMAILTALLSAFTVVRHTRHDEETGRSELINATPVGSHASLAAAITLGAGVNLVLTATLALALIASGLPAVGALAFGSAVGATGLVFVGVGAIAAQIAPSARAANALSLAALGLTYVLRAIGDATGDLDPSGTTATSAWPSWLSPIGWGQQVQPFADNHWWPIVLSLLALLIASATAVRLLSRRDFGQGLLQPRLGPSSAPAALLRPMGQAWRMQRSSFVAWGLGMLALGGSFGSVGRQIDDLSSNETLLRLLSQLGGTSDTLADSYFAAVTAIIGAIVACYPVQAILRLGGEESDGRLEPLLATALSRTRWLLAHLGVTTLGVLVLLIVAGAAGGLVYGLALGETQSQTISLTTAALAQAPAVLALGGLAVTALGLLPRWSTPITWTALTAALLLGPLGATLGLPKALREISPFTHIPAAPAEDITSAPLIALVVIGFLLSALGTACLNRRDLALSA